MIRGQNRSDVLKEVRGFQKCKPVVTLKHRLIDNSDWRPRKELVLVPLRSIWRKDWLCKPQQNACVRPGFAEHCHEAKDNHNWMILVNNHCTCVTGCLFFFSYISLPLQNVESPPRLHWGLLNIGTGFVLVLFLRFFFWLVFFWVHKFSWKFPWHFLESVKLR